jgi:hypothetical protein
MSSPTPIGPGRPPRPARSPPHYPPPHPGIWWCRDQTAPQRHVLPHDMGTCPCRPLPLPPAVLRAGVPAGDTAGAGGCPAAPGPGSPPGPSPGRTPAAGRMRPAAPASRPVLPAAACPPSCPSSCLSSPALPGAVVSFLLPCVSCDGAGLSEPGLAPPQAAPAGAPHVWSARCARHRPGRAVAARSLSGPAPPRPQARQTAARAQAR